MAYFIDGKDCMVSNHFSGKDAPVSSVARRPAHHCQISEWILLAAAYVFVALRVYTRLFRLREKLDWSDWLLIVSALDALGLIICDTLTYQMGVLDAWEPSVALSKVRQKTPASVNDPPLG